MNAQQQEVFRETVLRAFKASAGCGLSLTTLDVTLRACGFKGFAAEEIEAVVQYFMDKGFVAGAAAIPAQTTSPSNLFAYRWTSASGKAALARAHSKTCRQAGSPLGTRSFVKCGTRVPLCL
jgi:hypothetical protein